MSSCDDVAELAELVDAVRMFETDSSKPEEAPSKETVRTDLYHAQLPKLEDMGYIEFDDRQGTVRYEENPALEEWLEHAQYKEIGLLE